MSVKRSITGITLGAAVIAGGVMFAQAASAQVTYTQKQADDAKVIFNNHCATCHRPNLKGGQGPALIGEPFEKKWFNKPAAELTQYIHTNMPQTAPGSLPDEQLYPIVAYILSKNGVPAGDKEFTKDTASQEIKK